MTLRRAWPLSLAALLACPVAGADPAAAEALFREGRRLLLEGKLELACSKLDESQRQDPSSGTLLNLALCHEKQGLLATAWAEYVAAAELARAQQKPDRAEAAELQARALEPRLPKLELAVAEAIAGLELVLDGKALGVGALGTAFPVNPGEHELRARAPGRKPWRQRVTLGEGQTSVVAIPALEQEETRPEPPPPEVARAPTRPPAPAASKERPHSRVEPSRPLAPWLIGGAGIVALGAGTYFGVRSLDRYGRAEDLCPSRKGCSDEAVDERDTAEREAWISNVALGLGVVGVGAGVALLLGGSAEEPISLTATASSRSAGVRFGGSL